MLQKEKHGSQDPGFLAEMGSECSITEGGPGPSDKPRTFRAKLITGNTGKVISMEEALEKWQPHYCTDKKGLLL